MLPVHVTWAHDYMFCYSMEESAAKLSRANISTVFRLHCCTNCFDVFDQCYLFVFTRKINLPSNQQHWTLIFIPIFTLSFVPYLLTPYLFFLPKREFVDSTVNFFVTCTRFYCIYTQYLAHLPMFCKGHASSNNWLSSHFLERNND